MGGLCAAVDEIRFLIRGIFCCWAPEARKPKRNVKPYPLVTLFYRLISIA